MLKSLIERIARRVVEGRLDEMVRQLSVITESMNQLKSERSNFKPEEYAERLTTLEDQLSGIEGDWALTKRQLQRLHGQITKAAAIDEKHSANGSPEQFQDGEEVLAYARKAGLIR